MAEETGQEKTEEPTAKRLRDAKEKGDIPRSRELVTMTVLLASAAAAIIFGQALAVKMMALFSANFVLDREDIFDTSKMFEHLGMSLFDSLDGLLGFFAMLLAAALIGPIALGGWNFSLQAIAPKGSRLNPLSGIKRMFSKNAAMELFKAIAKVLLVGTVAALALWFIREDLLRLGLADPIGSIAQATELLMWVFLLLCASLILIAAIDVPFQIYSYSQKLKMTLQEVKDEYKNTEGKPEVKGRIRQMQREISQRQMMQNLPDADVVITNPTHFAVALKYEEGGRNAPIMVAKGADFVALKIREVAKEHDVPVLSAPALARALYHSTEINEEIPAGLFKAVAHVLAYVFQLKRTKADMENASDGLNDTEIEIPEEYRR
ncbi:MAG: flagellar biosynthesis protein FlhB [Pontibacterium sp.]